MASMTIELDGWIYEVGECGPQKMGAAGRNGHREDGFTLKMDRGKRIFFPVPPDTLRNIVSTGALNSRVKITMKIEVVGPIQGDIPVTVED